MAKLTNYNNEAIPIDGIYNGASCFLIVGGPSLKKLDLSKLSQPGIVTIGVNNSPKMYRPDIWISVDSPSNFMYSIWTDPRIMKVVMHGKRDKLLWNNIKWKQSTKKVSDCPNVIYYKDNEHFKPTEEYLDEDTFNWGNHTNRCECGFMRKEIDGKKPRVCESCGGNTWGTRSVMLAAIKLIYVLGFRKVFIIGADFKMDDDNKYAWDQNRSSHSIKSNNSTYEKLNERFDKLRPVFEKRNFQIFNSTPDSHLNSFIKIPFEDAIEIATKEFKKVPTERTFGMYERRAVEEKIEKETKKIKEYKEQKSKDPGNKRLAKRLDHKINVSNDKLRAAIEEREQIATWTA